MNAFTLLDIEGASKGEVKPRQPNVAVEMTKSCWIILEWDEVFARYEILLLGTAVMLYNKSVNNLYTLFIRRIKCISELC